MKKTLLKRITAAAAVMGVLAGTIPIVSASDINGTKDILCSVGDNLTVGTYPEAAAETEKLINSRPEMLRLTDDVDRGLVAVKADSSVFVSWKWLGTESLDVKYNLYKNGELVNKEPMSLTNYTDNNPASGDKYAVSAVVNGVEGERCDEVSVWEDGYLEIPLNRPEKSKMANGEDGSDYTPNDVSVADLDGDGKYEIVLKWDGLVRDAGKGGYTNTCIIDAYETDGTQLWRIDMGPNIRSGPHDTQFIVADFDNDGKAEMAVRTADGTVAADGTVIGDKDAKWYELNDGKNLQGPLYLTVFSGEDGTVIDTVDYFPQSTGTYKDGTAWDINSWGDDWGNRSERYLGALACLDGEHMSFIQSRGYYGRTCISAYHLENKKIVTDWTFDSHDYPAADGHEPYSGQGYHNLSIADVDYDGKDEVIFGSMNIDHDGSPMYSTEMYHGDSMHVGDFVPDNPGLEVYTCQEYRNADYGFYMRDARTGNILYGLKTETDNGRACVADIDPDHPGEEAWSAYGVLTAADGTVLSTNYSMPANFAIYWDSDIGREIEDGNGVYKWNVKNENMDVVFKAVGAHSINAAKSNPCIQADILGDWREELIYPANDNEHLRIYTTTEPTSYRIPSLMSDWEYRDAIGWQNVCYNQTPHLGYYLGYDTKTVPVPMVYSLDENGGKISNPDLSKKEWSIDELYFGDTVELVPDVPTAFVNGAKKRVDNDNAEVVPYVNSDDRTMVPIRFISEAYGADVDYDDDTAEITISCLGKDIVMKPGHKDYTVNGETKTMDTVAELRRSRAFVPLRTIAEMLDKNVGYYDAGNDTGLVYISSLDKAMTDENAAELMAEISSTSVPEPIDMTRYAEDYGNKEMNNRVPVELVSTSDETDAAALLDYDLNTSWTCPAGGSVIIDSRGWGTPGVVIAFGDDKVHHFQIEYSGDLFTWQIGLAGRTSDGKKGVYEKYYYGCPLYPRYVKYTSLDDEDTIISEFVSAVVD